MQHTNAEKPVREWDVGKKPDLQRSRDQERDKKGRERSRERDRSDRRRRSSERQKESPSGSPNRKFSKKENEPPLRLLDDLFRKTKTTPCIYWLPLTPEQVNNSSLDIDSGNSNRKLLILSDCDQRTGTSETVGSE